MTYQNFRRFPIQALLSRCVAAASLMVALASTAFAQAPSDSIVTLRMSVGRSQTVRSANAISNVSIANPDVADAVVISARDCVINAKANGTTDIVIWTSDGAGTHYRIRVRSAADRQMVLLSVRLAEVRRDVLRELGLSGLYRDQDGKVRIGWGNFKSGAATNETSGEIIPVETRFFTLLSNLGAKEFLGLLETEEKLGNARLLAEPNLLTGDGDSATFLAGGEIPIPVAQPTSVGGQAYVTVQYREFGIRLKFAPEIIADSLVRLWVQPEVSSLDYANAVSIAGFRIPALRTRRVESSVDVRDDQSLIISGLFNEEREQVKTGIPLLMHVPVIGSLFSSTRWQQAESELLVVVTPMLVDPANVDPSLRLPLMKDARVPASDALKKRLPPPPKP